MGPILRGIGGANRRTQRDSARAEVWRLSDGARAGNSTDRHTRLGNRRNPVLADSRRAARAWSSTCGSLRSCVQPRRPPDWGLGESKILNRLKNATRQFFPAPLRELRLSVFADGTDVIPPLIPFVAPVLNQDPIRLANRRRVVEGHDAGREGRTGREGRHVKDCNVSAGGLGAAAVGGISTRSDPKRNPNPKSPRQAALETAPPAPSGAGNAPASARPRWEHRRQRQAALGVPEPAPRGAGNGRVRAGRRAPF